MKSIEEIYAEAVKFVDEKFPNLRDGERRITILALMKNAIELMKLELDLKAYQIGETKAPKMVPASE